MWMSIFPVCGSPSGGQKRVSETLEPELRAAVSPTPMRVLGTELGSSGRGWSNLNHGAGALVAVAIFYLLPNSG